jgi:multiple sugar transport system substrate-binding protein
MKKSMLALSVITVASLLSLAGCGDDSPALNGKVINIECWNNEFQSRFEAFYPDFSKTVTKNGTSYDVLKDGTRVNFLITANDNNGYQTKLDADLEAQADADADDKIDMFLIEADYATKYTASSIRSM